jgi:hypothetical protein
MSAQTSGNKSTKAKRGLAVFGKKIFLERKTEF